MANEKFYKDPAVSLSPEVGNWELVYFGVSKTNNKQMPCLFRVLDASNTNTKGILLDCAQGYFDFTVFNESGSYSFNGSHVQGLLNNGDESWLRRTFSSGEISAIKSTSYGHLFLLTKEDLSKEAYGYSSNNNQRQKTLNFSSEYWTSSTDDNKFWYVKSDGSFASASANDIKSCHAIPALYLDPGKVLFWSNQNGTLSKSFNVWKLTLLNDGASVSVSNVAKCVKNNTIKLHYAINDSNNTYNNLSVLITKNGKRTDTNAEIVSLETVLENDNGIQVSGDVDYKLPEGFDTTKHHVYLVAQEQNDMNLTDFATVGEIIVPDVTDSHVFGEAYWKTTKEPTCTLAGEEEEYKKCEICETEVKTGSQPKSINALGHDYGNVIYTFSADGKKCTAERTCKREGCGNKETETVDSTSTVKIPAAVGKKGTTTYTARFANAAFAAQTKDIEDIPALEKAHEHTLVKTEAKAATATTAGNSEYWTCKECGKYFSDSKGTKEIVKNSWVIAATGKIVDKTHTHKLVKTDARDATATAPGNTAFWTCAECGRFYSDSKGSKEIKKDSWVIPANGSSAGAPATKGTTIADKSASYKVTSSDAKNPTVAYKATKSSKATKITIPGSVKINGVTYKITEISKNAFKNNKNVNTVSIHKNITKIGNYAFSGCTSLTQVTGGAGVKSVGKGAFNNCQKLKKAPMGSKVTTIGANAFYNCKKLTKTPVGANVTSIGDKAFYNCESLTTLTFPAKTVKLGKQVAKGTKKLKTLTIKNKKLKAKGIGNGAFTGMGTKKTVVKVPKGMKKSYTKMFRNKGLNKNIKVQESK